MTKKILFDTGPIISLTTNNLLFILDEFKKKNDIEFFITPSVKKELVDKPLEIKRFKFEALQVLECIKRKTINVFEDKLLDHKTVELLTAANNIFSAKGAKMQIVHYGEMETIIAANILNADTIVVDERTTRILLENADRLRGIIEGKLHTQVSIDRLNLEKFKKSTLDIKVIRSFELVTIAYELGILDKFLPDSKDSAKILLESILWGVKLNGCAVSEQEIDTVIEIEAKTNKRR